MRRIKLLRNVIGLVFLPVLLVLSACSAKVSSTIVRSYPSLDYREEVRILGLTDSVPSDAEELGLVKIGDSGFSTDCGWEVVIDHAKTESRKVGGNVLKIIEHRLPDMVSSCHRIVANVHKIG